nr:DUF294 nucleotidyltransferase-like domain-containing protein [Texcoconibacillus texcoconensis]
MLEAAGDYRKQNVIHEKVITEAVQLAIEHTREEWGTPPSPFAFFVMGSAGRNEQALWSDQDHGIVFQGSDRHEQDYFLTLGIKIEGVMSRLGYPRCEGKVMASSPRWCHGINEWIEQVDRWIKDDKWSTLRHLLTLMDARVVIGSEDLLKKVKKHAFIKGKQSIYLLKRLAENAKMFQPGTNLFGQLIYERTGQFTGAIPIKNAVLFPYVHALKLLSFKRSIYETETIERMRLLSNDYSFLAHKRKLFIDMLELRSSFSKQQHSYQDVHYVPISQLSKGERKRVKEAVKEGKELLHHAKSTLWSNEEKRGR